MRRLLAAGLITVGFLVTAAPSCQPTEPAMTITAVPHDYPLAGTTSTISGKVTPATATTKVVLQKTKGGKWVDWESCPAIGCQGQPPKVPRANVDQTTGAYTMTYPVQWCGQVLHLRVRSLGGSAVSPGFYTEAESSESC